ncbi:nucleoside diphosphate-linked moiety X motif 19 [Trichosurus vulpecula]|uniref:nucleoside diphosphate-linked moiety X motif 19 n=1 Tax=Trichosurus vulpecula TaxID=9337 RepID=UPI00186B4DFC|nr:nucleoside diphosphate-linked moiety X motif 19 [Trichosurus vulpecula]
MANAPSGLEPTRSSPDCQVRILDLLHRSGRSGWQSMSLSPPGPAPRSGCPSQGSAPSPGSSGPEPRLARPPASSVSRERASERPNAAWGASPARRMPGQPAPGPLRPGPAMQGSLRQWRRAATLLLAVGRNHPGPSPAAATEDYELLLLQRGRNSGFMPGAHVFPGGVMEAADSSSDWLSVFQPHHGPPSFGLPLPRQPRETYPEVAVAPRPASHSLIPDDVAFRICAIRETFEESGILLLLPKGAEAPHLPRAHAPLADLAAWRARVQEDPGQFLQLCQRLGCAPNIWALQEWSNWLTPFVKKGGRRFDTRFYVCCLHSKPQTFLDMMEAIKSEWVTPTEAIKKFLYEEIWLAPPQFYEIRRLVNFASLSDLHKFCLDRSSEGCERWLPIMLLTLDGAVQLLPGDELYHEDKEFLEKNLSINKKTEEIMEKSKKFHRIVLRSRYLYNIYVTIQPKYKHIYPKNFLGFKSHL